MKIDGVAWLLFRSGTGAILLERCPKKAAKLGVGRWFVPGGKIERGETATQALLREVGEEWPGVTVLGSTPLPLVQASHLDARGIFLMRPFVITVSGTIPKRSADGPELRWTPTLEALLLSPVPQVRMMVAAAMGGKQRELSQH